jgi:hypothetical protein
MCDDLAHASRRGLALTLAGKLGQDVLRAMTHDRIRILQQWRQVLGSTWPQAQYFFLGSRILFTANILHANRA